jgi:UDP-3-O-[3-hydroxymyristoyl] glucosamine N-acyltransferase
MKAAELARQLGGELIGNAAAEITGVAAIEDASPSDLTFADSPRALEQAADCQAACILVDAGALLPGKTLIAVKRAKLAFIQAVALLLPPRTQRAGIHPSTVIHPEATVAPDAVIGPHAIIERGATVGTGTFLGAGVFVGENASIGSACHLHPHVSIYPGVRIGDRVVLHSGVVIGSDGFGYVFDGKKHAKFPQLGRVIIEDDVEIGSNTTVDRGSLGTTRIGQGTKIDNLVQIAHNVRLGKHCVVAAQTGISGSCDIGDYVVIGGQVGFGDHVRVEDGATIGSQAGILPGKIVRKGSIQWGTPARPLPEFKKMYAHFSALPELAQKVKRLERQLEKR